jgi:hypothetical protein
MAAHLPPADRRDKPIVVAAHFFVNTAARFCCQNAEKMKIIFVKMTLLY